MEYTHVRLQPEKCTKRLVMFTTDLQATEPIS